MAEFYTFHTTRKPRTCDGSSSVCVSEIARGDRFCKSAMAPGGEYGGLTWEHMTLCAPCAGYYGKTDPMVKP